MIMSNDIETALYTALTAAGYSASAHVIPASLGDDLPHVHVTRTGGFTSDRVIEDQNVDFDIYCDDPVTAMATASDLCGFVRDLAGDDVGSPCYAAEVITLPYHNPDPRHASLARVTFKANLLCRVLE